VNIPAGLPATTFSAALSCRFPLPLATLVYRERDRNLAVPPRLQRRSSCCSTAQDDREWLRSRKGRENSYEAAITVRPAQKRGLTSSTRRFLEVLILSISARSARLRIVMGYFSMFAY